MKTKLLPLVLLTLSQGVLAQQLPGAGTQLQQLPPPPTPQPAVPQIKIEETTAPLAPGSDSVRILVNELRVTGASVYTPAQLIAVAQFKTGSQLTLSDLQAMAARITDFYHRHGYFVARAYVPAQDVTTHVVTIDVSEGKYGKVILRNQSRLSDQVALGRLNGLNSGEAITIAPLESRLLLLSAVPGVKVKSTLVPGAEPGSSDLVVDVAPGRLITGSIDADNAGNPYTGENRIGATINLNDPLGRGDQASLRLLTSGRGLKYGRLSYQMPFGPRFTAGAAYSKLDYRLGKTGDCPGAAPRCVDFTPLDANGSAEVASVFGTLNLVRSRRSNLYAGLAYEDRTFQDRIDRFGLVTDKKAHVAIASLYGNHQDDIGGGGMNSFFLSLSAGTLDIQTPLQRAADAQSARTNGSYSKLWLNAARVQHVTDIFSLRASVTGQLASKNLDPSEKMVLGGMDGVRAYPQGEAFGDQGYIADLEASLLLAGLSAHVPGQVHLLAFVDAGHITVNKNPWYPDNPNLSSDNNTRDLSSAGVGLTWDDPGNFAVRMYYARKLGSEDATSAPDKSGRFWIQAVKFF
ncbi:MAG: ShlB/FhaC/HecB family hemolysin secretion/activation protein [Xanthomonadaceae bacterium]|nr:ShlB/FhaC/HecB family hemolysin secretion/activation protein [Xanthomonadaceae bacterium]